MLQCTFITVRQINTFIRVNILALLTRLQNPVNASFNNYNIQAGQGFFVLAEKDNVPFSFTSTMQIHNTAVPMTKSAQVDNSWPGSQLKVKYGDKEHSTLVVYNESMTSGLDPIDVGPVERKS